LKALCIQLRAFDFLTVFAALGYLPQKAKTRNRITRNWIDLMCTSNGVPILYRDDCEQNRALCLFRYFSGNQQPVVIL